MNMVAAAVLGLLVVAANGENYKNQRGKLAVSLPPFLSGSRTKSFQYDCGKSEPCNGIPHAEAMFGIPEYGGSLSGRLYYATPGNVTGCHLYDPHPEWTKDPTSVFILLVDRGDCNFVTKVRYAQQMGAKGVIVVDDACMRSEPKGTCPGGCLPVNDMCPYYEKGKSCDTGNMKSKDYKPFPPNECKGDINGLPVMADDNTGNFILIPSYLVSHYHGQVLKNAICAGDQTWKDPIDPAEAVASCKPTKSKTGAVLVTMKWETIKPKSYVDWYLWTSSEDWHGALFKQEFGDIAKRLWQSPPNVAGGAQADGAHFTPYYFFYDGTEYGCDLEEANCGNQCLSNGLKGDDWKGGLYCRPDPEDDQSAGLSGKDLAEENLRQLCLWKQVKGRATWETGQKIWWTYVNLFALKCFGMVPDAKDLQTCRTTQMGVAGLTVLADVNQVNECVSANSGEQSDIIDEQILRRLGKENNVPILHLPTIEIDGAIMRGGTQPLAVLKEICAGLSAANAPAICAAASNPMAASIVEGDSYKVENTMLLQGMKSVDEFTYMMRSQFKQRLGLELGVAPLAIEFTTVETSTDLGGGVRITVEIVNLASEEESSKVITSLIELPDFSIFTQEEDVVPVLSVEGTPTTILVASTKTETSNITEAGISVGVVILIVLMICAIFVIGGFVYYRHTQNAMRAQVRNILQEYMPMDESGSAGSNTVNVASRHIGDSETASMI